MMKHVYVLGGLRSHIGIKGQRFKHLSAEELGAEVLTSLLAKYRLPADQIDCIISGNGVGAGGNITRLMSLTAGLAETIPAFTVDVQCGSALESIAIAAAKIESGEADLIVAGGFESSSTQPLRSLPPNHPNYKNSTPYTVAPFMPGIYRESVMLEGAELVARKEGFSRPELDQHALDSHQKALFTQQQGVLETYITSVRGSTKDDGIRPRMNLRLLSKLPALLPDGDLITAGNACLMHDGAAFVILCSKAYLDRNPHLPIAKIKTSCSIGGNPLESPRTAITAIQTLLAKSHLTDRDISCFEVNEPFAVIDALFLRNFPDSATHYNLYGGALAYGHPYGASGAIIFLHLLAALEQHQGQLGIASIAAAGGIGTALLIERCI